MMSLDGKLRSPMVLLAGKSYRLMRHEDGRPGFRCDPNWHWAWPGVDLMGEDGPVST